MDDGLIYERCEAAKAIIGRRPIVVRRTEGKLGSYVIALLGAEQLTVVDAPIGCEGPPTPTKHLRCWVSEAGLMPPRRGQASVGAQPPTVAVASCGYRGHHRAALIEWLGEAVAWAPLRSVELLECLARALAPNAPDPIEPPDCWCGVPLDAALQAACRRYGLRPREAEVTRGMAVSLTNRQIAAQLPIEIDMVKKSIRTSFEKMHIRGRAAVPFALASALEHGGRRPQPGR